VIGGGVGVFWAFLSLSSQPAAAPAAPQSHGATVTNPELAGGVVPMQVAPVDQWLGTAGKELAQYKVDREGQEKFNADRKANEAQILQRLAELEKKEAVPPSVATPAAPEVPPVPANVLRSPIPSATPPAYPPEVPAVVGNTSPTSGAASGARIDDSAPVMVRVVLGNPGRAAKG